MRGPDLWRNRQTGSQRSFGITRTESSTHNTNTPKQTVPSFDFGFDFGRFAGISTAFAVSDDGRFGSYTKMPRPR